MDSDRTPDENADAAPSPAPAPAPRTRSATSRSSARADGARAAENGAAAQTTSLPAADAPTGSTRSVRRESPPVAPEAGRREPARRAPEPTTTELSTSAFRLGEPRPGAADPGATYEVPIRPAADETTVPTNIYRARRPGAAILLIIPALLVGLLLVRGLAIAAFGQQFLLGGVIASSLALTSLPLLVGGLYGLMTGAAYGAEQFGFKVWARPPLAYLLVGLGLVLAAGLAAR